MLHEKIATLKMQFCGWMWWNWVDRLLVNPLAATSKKRYFATAPRMTLDSFLSSQSATAHRSIF